MLSMTNRQARQFLLLKHGLLGTHKFVGKQGVMDFVHQVGCVQYDPVDVCGRSADITLNSRINGYTKDMLAELLYKDRRLVDYFDKNLSIFPMEELPILLSSRLSGGYAETYDKRGGDAVKQIEPLIRQLIKEHRHITAAEVKIDETIEWHWGTMASLPRAALESMYFRGELIIHHKSGTNKSYALTSDHIPKEILNAKLPYKSEEERLAWHVKRRIGAVGLLWNRTSDAWLGLRLKSPERTSAFEFLMNEGAISEVKVEGLKETFYLCTEDMPTLEAVVHGLVYPPRTELIAPLDNMMWDRKLIVALFGFDYTWEIYTPEAKRKYGAYVLPILQGERFIGRVEVVCNRKTKTLLVKNVWYEDGVKPTKKSLQALDKCFNRFANFNGCGIEAPGED